MVLVIVSVHSISADRVQIGESIQMGTQISKFVVRAEVRGIGAWNPYQSATYHIFAVDQANLLEFTGSKVQKLRIVHAPQVVALVTKIFQAQPDGFRVGN